MEEAAIKEMLGFVWHIAQPETERLGHEYLDTTHVLLALVQTRRCQAYSLLSKMGAFPSHIYREIGRDIPQAPGFEPRGVTRPITKKVLEILNKVPEMMRLECKAYPVSVVLLIAMLRQEGTLAQTILSSFGVTEEKVRDLEGKNDLTK